MVEALLENLAAVTPGALGFGGRTAAATGMNAAAAAGFAGTESGAADPMLCLLLWAAMLASDGELDLRLLRQAGLDETGLKELAAKHPRELAHLRQLRLCGAVFSREALAGLLRGRLSEMLMSARKPSDLLALTKMMERMPQWMWGADAATECGATRGGGNSTAAEVEGLGEDGLAALQLLSELLNAKQGETSEAEITDMLLRATALADKLDSEGAYMPTMQRSAVRKPSYTKKRQRRQ